MQRLITFFIKAGISTLLLYLSLRGVDLSGVGQRLGGLDVRWMILIVSILCVQMALLALRWREIVMACGAELSLKTALSYTFSGQFFSQVLPSTIGGDAFRIWLLARNGAGWQTASYSVLIDRVVGVSILAILVVVCIPWTFDMIHDPIPRAALAIIGSGTLIGALVFLALGAKRLQATERWWPTRHLAAASRVARRLFRSIAGARVAALSLAIHLITVLVAWGAAMAVRAEVDFIHALVLVLPVILIATIPISIAGWGVRESAMVLAFSYAGLTASDGLIVSILFGIANLAIGAVGGIVWIASGYRQTSVKNIAAATLAASPSS